MPPITVVSQNMAYSGLFTSSGERDPHRWDGLMATIGSQEPDILLLQEVGKWEDHNRQPIARAEDALGMRMVGITTRPAGGGTALMIRPDTIKWEQWEDRYSDQTLHGFGVGVLRLPGLGAPGQQRSEYASGTLPGIRTLPQVARLLDEAGTESARVGVGVDSVSWASTGADPTHLSALGHPVRHVRIADIPHRVPAHRWGPTHRLMPGDGALPWPAFTSALEQVRYRGPVAVAVSNPRIRDLPGPEIITRSARSLAQVCSTLPATTPPAYATLTGSIS